MNVKVIQMQSSGWGQLTATQRLSFPMVDFEEIAYFERGFLLEAL